jgi:CheY-like chemotaxis protein
LGVLTAPGRSVLVVDDEPALRLLLSRFLEGEDYRVESAANGVEALAAVRRHPPDAVLLDLVMPEMDGWDFLRACRATAELADLPVIVMSATPNLGRQSLAELNVGGCLSKPFDLDSVTGALDAIWEALPTCNVCSAAARARQLTVFEDGISGRSAIAWQVCRKCWRLLESGFASFRPTTALSVYLERPGMHITETELRGYVAAGVSAARRGRA